MLTEATSTSNESLASGLGPVEGFEPRDADFYQKGASVQASFSFQYSCKHSLILYYYSAANEEFVFAIRFKSQVRRK